MTELEKCMAGQWYNCHDPVFLARKGRARALLREYNALAYEQKGEKTALLRQLVGSMGSNVSVAQPFLCDYGCNIHLGSNVSVNMNCTFVDCNRIDIGDNVLIASNVQLYTAAHPVELGARLTPDWSPDSGEYFCRTYALPIRIGSGCWLGGGAIVLPGVAIGEGCVIGAGSVVTRDIPPTPWRWATPAGRSGGWTGLPRRPGPKRSISRGTDRHHGLSLLFYKKSELCYTPRETRRGEADPWRERANTPLTARSMSTGPPGG